MSFDLILVGIQADDEQALARLAAEALSSQEVTQPNGVVELAQGSWLEWHCDWAEWEAPFAYGSVHLAMRGDREPWASAIFTLAETLGAYVIPVESPRAIKTPNGEPEPEAVEGLDIVQVADAAQLAEELSQDISSFIDFREKVTASPLLMEPASTGFFSSLLGRKR